MPGTRLRSLIAWSSGKDSAWTLGRLAAADGVEVAGLWTTVSRRGAGSEAPLEVGIHGTPLELVEAQARSLALPLHVLELPRPCPNERYRELVAAHLEALARDDGIANVAFGDLFLDDIRAFREDLLAGSPVVPRFPLWHGDRATIAPDATAALAREMIAAGLDAVVTAVDTTRLEPRYFLGRRFDADFLADLPAGVDPCGENGEFHTFVHRGPGFRKAVAVELGEEEREGALALRRPRAG